MRAWQTGAGEGINSLCLVTRDMPVPTAGEVLVRVRAAALNHRDLMIVSGRYRGRKPPHRVPLGDGVGIVVALGAGASGWAIGQRVSAVHFVRWREGRYPGDAFEEDLGATRDGWLAEYIVLPADALVAVPDAIDDLHAATMPATGATAWAALHDFAQVSAGETVLTIGTGGVSAMALAIGRLAGARTVLLSSSQAKIELAAAQGMTADIAIDTSACPDWPAEVMRLTGGADIVIETVGTTSLPLSIRACAVGGRIALIGALGGTEPVSLDGLIAKTIAIKGIASGSRAMLAALLDLFAQTGERPILGGRHAFDDAPAAYRALAAGGHVGKLAIELGR